MWPSDEWGPDDTLKIKEYYRDEEKTIPFNRFTIYGGMRPSYKRRPSPPRTHYVGHGYEGAYDEKALGYDKKFFEYVCT